MENKLRSDLHTISLSMMLEAFGKFECSRGVHADVRVIIFLGNIDEQNLFFFSFKSYVVFSLSATNTVSFRNRY